jgi:hypothetical protein
VVFCTKVVIAGYRDEELLLKQQQESERIAILTKFIHSNPEARELKRAMAVKWRYRVSPTLILPKFRGCISLV